MIKIFFLNIIIAVIHLNTAESSIKLYSIDLNTGIVCKQYNTISLLHKRVDNSKNNAVDYAKNNLHAYGMLERKGETKYPYLNAEDLKCLSSNHRRRYNIFETDVSPPFELYI